MLSAPPACSIYLEQEEEVQTCSRCEVDISERGMRFACCREFALGTTLAVALTHMHPRRGMCHVMIEGIVVWCESHDGKRFESTVLFLELPDELRPGLREFSYQLATHA